MDLWSIICTPELAFQWTLRERRPHTGQRADAFFAVAEMLIVSPVMSMSSRWKWLSWGETLVGKDRVSMTKR